VNAKISDTDSRAWTDGTRTVNRPDANVNTAKSSHSIGTPPRCTAATLKATTIVPVTPTAATYA
jgi:hypothetical protein